MASLHIHTIVIAARLYREESKERQRPRRKKKVEKKSDTIYPIFRCTDIADVIYITFNP